MTHMDPKFLDRARAVFAANAHPSLADVRALVDAELTGTRRRDLLSRHFPDDIQNRGNHTTVPAPKGLYPLCRHPIA